MADKKIAELSFVLQPELEDDFKQNSAEDLKSAVFFHSACPLRYHLFQWVLNYILRSRLL